MTERIDSHSHSAYSGHGSGTVHDMVQSALDKGLTNFVQSEHLVLPEGMDPTFESSMSFQTMEQYLDDLHREREWLASQGAPMELVIGIEADWLDDRTAELEKLCQPFEYVLGSVHFIDQRPFDDSRDLSLWDERGVDGVWRDYFNAWLAMAQNPGPIMAFAHPDLPKKYGWFPCFDARDFWHEMAVLTAKGGRMIEVNTAGLRKDVGRLYPSLEMLKMFKDAGIDCTIGSDAHAPVDVAANYEDAVELMRQAGYKYVTVPRFDGDRRYISIDD